MWRRTTPLIGGALISTAIQARVGVARCDGRGEGVMDSVYAAAPIDMSLAAVAGTAPGLACGFFARKLSVLAILGAGGALVALEASRSYGYVNVNWETLRRDALPFAADIPDRAVRLLNANASAAGAGFALGFALGWRVG